MNIDAERDRLMGLAERIATLRAAVAWMNKMAPDHMNDAMEIIDAQAAEIERMETIANALLNHCDKDGGECRECGRICCPHGESLHFHHDGCPACAQDEGRS